MKSPVRPRASTARQSLEFFKGFLKNPREVGSVIPSSRFLTRRTLECGDIAHARVIVELGPGTGVLTRHALQRMTVVLVDDVMKLRYPVPVIHTPPPESKTPPAPEKPGA